MTNRYSLVCLYCNNEWGINYVPKDEVYCGKCKDSNIRVIDNLKEKVDPYMGCPPFPEKTDSGGRKDDRDKDEAQEKWYI
jgi:hypothetical protein